MKSFSLRTLLVVAMFCAACCGSFVAGVHYGEPQDMRGQAVVPTVLSPMPTDDPVEITFARPQS